MPFYDYECTECGTVFTKQERYDEHERRRNLPCPECRSRRTRQLVPAAHVQTSKKS